MIARYIPVLHSRQFSRSVIREFCDISDGEDVALCDFLDFEVLVDDNAVVFFEFETTGFENGGGGLDSYTEDDDIGWDGGTILENDSTNLSGVGGRGSEMRKGGREIEFGAFAFVELNWRKQMN